MIRAPVLSATFNMERGWTIGVLQSRLRKSPSSFFFLGDAFFSRCPLNHLRDAETLPPRQRSRLLDHDGVSLLCETALIVREKLSHHAHYAPHSGMAKTAFHPHRHGFWQDGAHDNAPKPTTMNRA